MGLHQKELAKLIGCHEMTIVHWELGHREPQVKYIPKIVEIIGWDPRPEPKTMGEELVRIRTAQGLLQRDFAVKIGIDPTTLARWERDEKLPWGDSLMKLKCALGLPVLK